jgi:hypothetical protein
MSQRLNPMKPINVIRWILVLPAAAAGFTVGRYLGVAIRFFQASSLGDHLIADIVTSIASGSFLAMFGMAVAPKYKTNTGYALAGANAAVVIIGTAFAVLRQGDAGHKVWFCLNSAILIIACFVSVYARSVMAAKPTLPTAKAIQNN